MRFRPRAVIPLACLAVTAALSFPSLLCAQNLGGGAVAPGGKTVKVALESWIPGATTRIAFHDAPASTTSYIVVISTASSPVALPGFNGTLYADLSPGRGFWVFAPAAAPITVPMNLAGSSLVLQGATIDANGQGYLTDAIRIDFFNPIVMVGNSRQSSNSISVVDLPSRAVAQRLTDSELGNIVFSYDRRWAYVTEPGSLRNRISAYDLTNAPIGSPITIAISGGIRYRCAVTRDGKRLYVPVHDGISVVDTDPTSPGFHTELRVLKVPITGNTNSIFTGPMSVALDLFETKLYIAYGEPLTYPAPSTIGVIDLNQAGFPHRSIPVQTGGTFVGMATRMDIRASADGLYVYAVEFAAQPIPGWTIGFANGGLLNVVSTLTDTEVKTITTNGFVAQELAVDRNGCDLWVAQIDAQTRGQILRVDVDAHSLNRFSIRRAIQVGTQSFSFGSSGPRGIDVTPDGSTLCVSIVEGAGQAQPEMWTFDTWTEQFVGAPVVVESLPGTVSITQY